MTRLPLDFGPLVEMAIKAARDGDEAVRSVRRKMGGAHVHAYPSWHGIPDESKAVLINAAASLLSDLTRRDSQALWLGCLARALGVPEPVVGCPVWRRSGNEIEVSWWLGGRVMFVFGPADPTSYGTEDARIVICPALDNPDSVDAPIRALVVAVLAVGAK